MKTAHGFRNTLLMAIPSQLLCCTLVEISYELNLSSQPYVTDLGAQLYSFKHWTSVAIFKMQPFLIPTCYVKSINTLSIHALKIHDSRATKFSAIELPKRVCETPQEPTNFYKPSFGDLTLFSWRHCISGVIFLSRALGMNCRSATIGAGII